MQSMYKKIYLNVKQLRIYFISSLCQCTAFELERLILFLRPAKLIYEGL